MNFEEMLRWLYELREAYHQAWKDTHKTEYKAVWTNDIDMVDELIEVVYQYADLHDVKFDDVVWQEVKGYEQ